ncbi:hypothetical protein MMC13_004438 [Lambiella insularis]|nr:hypothetical protein [Lambiella insularis]
MKFAKELEQDLVPEWRAKYLDYKLCKKKVKAVEQAFRHLSRTPKTPGRRRPANLFSSASYQLPIQSRSPFAIDDSLDETTWSGRESEQTPNALSRNSNTLLGSSRGGNSSADTRDKFTSYFGRSPSATSEQHDLKKYHNDTRPLWDSGTVTNYGSIVASPPAQPRVPPPMLELPDPALSPETEDSFPRHNRAWRKSRLGNDVTPPVKRSATAARDAYEVGQTNSPSRHTGLILPKRRNFLRSGGTFPTRDGLSLPHRSPFLRRMFSVSGAESPPSPDVPLESYREYETRQGDFFAFLDKELDKIETFYKMKEVEASDRLSALRKQLHEMRDRRLEEIVAAQEVKEHARREQERLQSVKNQAEEHASSDTNGIQNISGFKWIKPIEQAIGGRTQQVGKNAKALEYLGSPPSPASNQQPRYHQESWRDFTRRPAHRDDVPYRVAKRKLKLALQEFYRGLELLKSYALLNRTAFRKINKKYDKAVHARPTGRYVSEKVNKAWFVQSEVLDGHIVAVEDLYARYFEKGNHKVAVGKLRAKHLRADHYNSSSFRNGLFAAAGVVLGIQGVVYAHDHLNGPDPETVLNTTYLLQLYGGYFLGLLLFLLFCLDCGLWTRAKINYVFIFEFDNRHNLDWRQLAELPCFFLFLEGLFLWLNFQQSGANSFFLYWFILLIGLTVIVLFLPAPILYHRSRQWWAYSNFRLLLAGLYPVEFRDFFLGDMYCSLTYAMGNVELFFCLYAARNWSDPHQCNSTNSRLLGFLSTLPGIWRAFQCLRRYYDTRNAFPHLVNCGKYLFTIIFYMSLSIYRIDQTLSNKVFFILCATINSIYTSVWDLAMDWSLCNPYAEQPFLREVLGYKRPWIYYVAMVVDPILRFNWIFYAILPGELQHSAILSFLVSTSEICRRGMWTLFRVENEHCTNVGRFRASRDVPLPYSIPAEGLEHPERLHHDRSPPLTQTKTEPRPDQSRPHAASGADLESATTAGGSSSSPSTLRRRNPLISNPSGTPLQRGIARVGTIMAAAHAQDFERRRPEVTGNDLDLKIDHEDAASSDEDEVEGEDHDNEQDVLDAGALLDRHRSATS